VRYLFRGLIRETGRPVEGHVEAMVEEEAYEALASNGVVTESLVADPKPLSLNEELPKSPEFADALESAFDSSSSQVEFDKLAERYHGKKVWVIDRDKIRRRAAQVVDAALALGAQHGEANGKIRERVANAIQGLFSDNRNIASERNADSIAGMRFTDAMGGDPNSPAPPVRPMAPAPAVASSAASVALESQIARMANLVRQAEAALAAVTAAARRSGSGGGGGGPRRRSFAGPDRGEQQNTVLLEIFKSNLSLVRGMEPGATEAVATAVSEAPSSATSDDVSSAAEAAGSTFESESDSIPGAEQIAEHLGQP
jgi:hypothetical protein